MKMKLLFVCTTVFMVAYATSIQEQWQEFKLNHGKIYKSLLEEKRRFAIFQDNVRQFQEHNAKYAKGEISYSVGINQFTDWSKEEFKASLSPIESLPKMDFVRIHNSTNLNLGVDSVNWVTKGYVTSVKEEKHCRSSWAFSAVGAIEGQVAKNGGGLVSLSAQNLLDCSTDNYGCIGGTMVNAFYYVEKHGILTEEEYPYVAFDGECRKQGGIKISNRVYVDKTEAALMNALTTAGPLCVGIDATELASYSGGIFDNSSGCSTYISDLNHGVLAVGAGTENGKDYWLIKNSWGPKWGLDGYFKLARGQNACGVNTYITYPVL